MTRYDKPNRAHPTASSLDLLGRWPLTDEIGSGLQLVGDYLFVTNKERVARRHRKKETETAAFLGLEAAKVAPRVEPRAKDADGLRPHGIGRLAVASMC